MPSDPRTGQAIVAYVTLKGNLDGSPQQRLAELREHVGGKIGKVAMPANIIFTPELPKTRSGKIMRRLLRDIAEYSAFRDSTRPWSRRTRAATEVIAGSDQ